MEAATDALLAFAHHDPDDADPLVRAGAFLVIEFLFGFRGLLKFIGARFSGKRR